MKVKWMWGCLAAGAILCSCTRDFSIFPVPETRRPWTALEKEVLSTSSDFGIRLFKELIGTEAEKNVFISPLSVSLALGMTLNGAAGQTEADMRDVLGFSGMGSSQINEAYRQLTDRLKGMDPGVVLEIANSLWARLGFEVEKPFIEANRSYFDALARTLDFGLPSAKDTINGWIETKTHGRVQHMVERIGRDDVLFIVDAVFFKGIWTVRFDESLTRNGSFIQTGGTALACPMMHLETDLPYLETDEFQAVDLDYGSGHFSMTVLLPKEGVSVDALASMLTSETWADWTGRFTPTNGALTLPKFKTEYGTDLKQALIRLGMGVAFTGGADFTRISRTGGLFIGQVLHKAFVDVNEEGTEAAAATVVVILRGPPSGFQMAVTRPFLFAIREKETGAVLFIGKIVDPTR